jgi:Guanosine polyphosphate pyrophosphohydrolases/synthetases
MEHINANPKPFAHGKKADSLLMDESEQKSPRKLAGSIRHRLMLLVDEFAHADRIFFENAVALAEEAHQGQYRRPMDTYYKPVPYIVHPMRVALILLEEVEIKDMIYLTSAILHDVIESNREKYTVAMMEAKFGRPIAMMCSILTKPEIDDFVSDEEAEARLATYYKRLEQAGVGARIVKLADRLDSVREAIEWSDRATQERYLAETKAAYVPFAEATDSYLHEELVTACEELEALLAQPPGTASKTDNTVSQSDSGVSESDSGAPVAELTPAERLAAALAAEENAQRASENIPEEDS